MDRSSPYYKAHLVTAAARVMDHKDGAPPTILQISQFIGAAPEEVQNICNNLKELGVLRLVEAGEVQRVYILDPAPMEDLPKSKQGPDMEKEVEKFAAKQKARMDAISVQAKDEKQRKKDLFAALEKELKGRVSDSKS